MEHIPFDKREGYIWYDNQFVPWQDATVHVLNHGLHYASAVFEGLRIYNGEVFKLTEHSERLKKSAELIGFDIPYSVKDLDAATEATAQKNGVENGYIRPIAWRGSEYMAISAQKNTIHVAIAAWTWPPYYSDRNQGIKMIFADWKRPSPETAPCASKAAGLYMICTMSKHKAEAAGCQDALMLDYRGYVAEGASANFFMVQDGELHTPTPDCFLNGITRLTIIELAKKRGIKVVERHIKPEELANAQEAFLTGTAAEVTPIRQIEQYNFEVGPITNQLIDDYHQLVQA